MRPWMRMYPAARPRFASSWSACAGAWPAVGGGLARLCALNQGLELLPERLVPIEQVIGYAETGVRLRGDDQRAWCILGFAHTIAGNLPTGREATLTALDRNPDSLFFRDVIGYC